MLILTTSDIALHVKFHNERAQIPLDEAMKWNPKQSMPLWLSLSALRANICNGSITIPADEVGLVMRLSKFTRVLACGSRKSSGFLGPPTSECCWRGGREPPTDCMSNRSPPVIASVVRERESERVGKGV